MLSICLAPPSRLRFPMVIPGVASMVTSTLFAWRSFVFPVVPDASNVSNPSKTCGSEAVKPITNYEFAMFPHEILSSTFCTLFDTKILILQVLGYQGRSLQLQLFFSQFAFELACCRYGLFSDGKKHLSRLMNKTFHDKFCEFRVSFPMDVFCPFQHAVEER